ncbi:MAG: ATP-binding protein [Bifidobacteriaceae bacterium]|jgi:two-component system sensor histidine kinase SenX3|nr:ATP-binding protein [Bifidobacteriaceae bacterium]MCI1978176.1 ATP-binding protein [Bifidobacteriaceae bacterium]
MTEQESGVLSVSGVFGSSASDTSDSHIVFPPGTSSDTVVRELLDSIASASIIVDFSGQVRFSSLLAQSWKLTRSSRVVVPQLEDLVQQVQSDGIRRVREISFVAPGTPAMTTWLRVMVKKIAPERILILADDRSREHRFEQQRRDFVTNVAHELKTPSGAIGLLAETIASATDDAQAVQYFAGRIGVETRRLNDLVAKLIELERVQDTDATEDDREEIDVDTELASVMGEMEPAAAARNVELVTTFNDTDGNQNDHQRESLMVKGQHSLLHSALKNLIENAIKYSPEGSKVSVIVEPGREGEILIRVIDRGAGISQDDLPRIFERFYRTDSARSSKTGGTGIGLSIVKHSVERLHGKVTVWSRKGEGSTFTVSLPLVDGKQQEESKQQEREAS